MLGFAISAIKIIFLLGFIILIHEGGHFLVAKWCNIKVNEFSIGFGPQIWSRKGKETKYVLRCTPLGGFVNMEGEEENSNEQRAYNNASITKRIAIVVAGAIVNITFGILLFFATISLIYKNTAVGLEATLEFLKTIFKSITMLFTGNISIDDFSGPVGISSVIISAKSFIEYVYILSIISVSIGITNLLPIPALDGGKLLILLIEAIRRKPMNKDLELKIELMGLSFMIALSIYITYFDITKVLK